MTIQPKPHDLLGEQAPAYERAQMLAFAMQANDPAWHAGPADPREGAPCRWVHLTNDTLTIDVFRDIWTDTLEFRPCYGSRLNELHMSTRSYPFADRSVRFHCRADADIVRMLAGVITIVVPQCEEGWEVFRKNGLTAP